MESQDDAQPDIREAVLRGNWRLVKGVFIAGVLVIAWLGIWHTDASIYLCAMPVLAAGIVGWSKGFISVGVPEKSPRSEISWALVILAFVCFVIAEFRTPHLLHPFPLIRFWLPLAMILNLPMTLVLRRLGGKGRDWIWRSALSLAIGAVPPAVAATMSYNDRQDNGPLNEIQTAVKHKFTSTSRSGTSYKLEVWIDARRISFEVERSFYEGVSEGDYLRLQTGGGALGARWVYLAGLAGDRGSEAR